MAAHTSANEVARNLGVTIKNGHPIGCNAVQETPATEKFRIFKIRPTPLHPLQNIENEIHVFFFVEIIRVDILGFYVVATYEEQISPFRSEVQACRTIIDYNFNPLTISTYGIKNSILLSDGLRRKSVSA